MFASPNYLVERIAMLKILIVEDEVAIAELIQIQLTKAGYQCTCAFDGEQGADTLEKENFDLVILDIMMPKVNGYELMEYIRPMNIPVIFLTAKDTVKDKIKGLKMGADDYMVKPFDMEELLARVEAVFRRYGKSKDTYVFQDVTVYLSSRQVMKHGVLVNLTPKEFDLLVVLMQNKNVLLYREDLFEKVWETEYAGDSRTLDLHIQRLRKKLDWKEEIKTVFRMGYMLVEVSAGDGH